MLHITGLIYRIGERVLLDRAQATIPAGHRIGLVGPNGAGKTTLLRLIEGALEPQDGAISIPSTWRVATLRQDAPSGATSLIDTVLAADERRHNLLAEAETAADPDRIAEIHAQLRDIGAYAAPGRAAAILAGLGFPEAEQQRPASEFSGGWRMRVALAAALFADADLLMLDEPTNHLDLEATLWLEGFLARTTSTLIIVSHDRDLLTKVPTHILHLDQQKLTLYGGNYNVFETERRERLRNLARALTKQQAQRAHMQSFVDRFRYKASKARQAQSRLKALERLPDLQPIVENTPILLDFPEPEELPPPLIALDRVSAGYNGKPVLRNLDLRIDMDDRIALLGANGNGKSTLARILAGRLKPLSGTIHHTRKLRTGYFAQHQAEELVLQESALDHMARAMPDRTITQQRAQLGRFGFGIDTADNPVTTLSGGEKARLLIALMCHSAPHIMILDEPTNHLDIDTRDALVQAVNAYPGAVILISHDPHLISLVADRLWVVKDATCTPFDGDIADYTAQVIASRAPQTGRRPPVQQPIRLPIKAKDRRGLLHEARQTERKLEQLTAARQQIEDVLSDTGVYQRDPTQAAKLTQMRSRLTKQITAAETAWLDLQESLENT